MRFQEESRFKMPTSVFSGSKESSQVIAVHGLTSTIEKRREEQAVYSMGGIKSKPEPQRPQPLPKRLTGTPWRQIKGWHRGTREELRKHVASLSPVTNENLEVPFFNIFLIGQTKAGKSSFFNSINGLFRNKVIANKADTREAVQILTREFRIYEVRTSAGAAPLSWRIMDTMGVDTKTGEVDVRNILTAIDGHVPDEHKFTPGQEFFYGCPGYVANPTLADQAHCVAIVVDASQANHLTGEELSQLRALREGLIKRNVPSYIILTHIDQACEKVKEDVQNIHRSIIIRDVVSKARQSMGLPENQIFPVKNYTNEVELRDDLDILILYALRHMLYSAQDYIETCTM